MKNFGAPLPVGGGGTGVSTTSAGQVFAGPTSGAAAAPGFRALAAIDMAALLSTVAPAMNGTAAAGSTGRAADAGHVHPSDTSRLAAANNLSDILSIATALQNLGFAGSFGANGYAKIPFGGAVLVLQWGNASVGGETGITFPTSFPNLCTAVVATVSGTGGASNAAYLANCDGYSKTGFAIRPRVVTGSGVSVPSSTTFFYLAVGY